MASTPSGGVDIAILKIRTVLEGKDEALAALTTLEQRLTKLETTAKRTGSSTAAAGAGINRLREPLTSLTYQLAGTNPQLSQLVGILGSLAVGTGFMVAVLAGLAAAAYAFRKLGEDAREARKAQEESIDSLRKFVEARRIAGLGPGGQQITDIADARGRQDAIRRQLDVGMGRYGDLPEWREQQLRREYANLEVLIHQSEVELGKVQVDAMQENMFKVTEELKRDHEERKRLLEQQARDLAESTKRWVEQHGLGGTTRTPGAFWDPGGTGRGAISMPSIGPSNQGISDVQRQAIANLNALEGATGGVSDAFLALTPTIGSLIAAIGQELLSANRKRFEEFQSGFEAAMRAEIDARRQLNQMLHDSAIALAAFDRALGEDLTVRGLRATGQDDAADRLALDQRHQREREEFLRQHPLTGTLNPLYGQMTSVQGAEMAQLLAQQEARNKALAEEAERLAQVAVEEARRRAEEVRNFEESIRLRILYAQGFEEEARNLQRTIELRTVTEQYGDAMADLLRQLYAAEDAARAVAESERALASAREQAAAAARAARDIESLRADLSGDPLRQATAGFEAEYQRDWARVVDAFMAGQITIQEAEALRVEIENRRKRQIDEFAASQGAGGALPAGLPGGGNYNGAVRDEIVRNVTGITETQAARLSDVAVIHLAEAKRQTVLQERMVALLGGGGFTDIVDANLQRTNSRRGASVSGNTAVMR